jgi:hypothetical protein
MERESEGSVELCRELLNACRSYITKVSIGVLICRVEGQVLEIWAMALDYTKTLLEVHMTLKSEN